MRVSRLVFAAVTVTMVTAGWICEPAQAENALRAGASAVDITPTEFPVIQNGGFLEGRILLATEKLHARCLALDDGETRIALLVVDSCMIPRTIGDAVKDLVSPSAGLARDRILIAATHTHSAPSVMNYCLGSRADLNYTAFLLPKLVEAIETAVSRLAPAEAAWGRVDAGELTHCRRWITRADKMQVDPFGERTVRAMMHPGHANPDFVGPAGPTDPWLSFLSVRSADGTPLALLGNFAMHYFSGHARASADYFGHFCRQIARRIAPEVDGFVGMLSQGTSGDLWWGDYSRPKIDRDIESYTAGLVDLVVESYSDLRHRRDVPIGMAEERLVLGKRVPSQARLDWAREKLAVMGDRRPRDRPEVYAEQAIYLHENPKEEIVVQAIRIGDLGIAAMPNEVYGITGLKTRLRSPLSTMFTITLANGAAGYIPPPEQHVLGGYNTWPARTAGLEVEAEPKIAESALTLLESVSGKPRRHFEEPMTPYARAIQDLRPEFHWRLAELEGSVMHDAGADGRHGRIEGNVAFHLPGAREGKQTLSPYSSRAMHLAGGRLVGTLEERTSDASFSVVLEFWNGLLTGDHETTANLLRMGDLVVALEAGEGGEFRVGLKLNERAWRSEQEILSRQWHHLVLVGKEGEIECFINGRSILESPLSVGETRLGEILQLGGDWQGRLDKVAFTDRALDREEISGLQTLR